METFEANIIDVKQETPNVKTFKFDKNLNFKPGQYITATVQIRGREEKRPFSISSSPTDEYFTITVKKYEDSVFAEALFNLKEGDSARITGPMGRFIFEEDKKSIVLIAAGNGITPLMSMIKYATAKKLDNKLTLIYSNRAPEDVIFHKELLSLQKRNKNLSLVLTVTRFEGLEWKGLTGRIDEKMIRDNVKGLDTAIFYVCGPPEMVEATVNTLRSMDVEDSRIKTERFVRPKKS